MFKKSIIKYILILGIGFLWCSSIYLKQEQYLLQYMKPVNVYLVDMVMGSFCMAIGIYLFSYLYRKNKNIKKIYMIFMTICIIGLILFYIIKSNILSSIVLCLICIIGTAGYGGAYHFSLVASNVDSEYRGRVFSIGYTIGIVGTYLLSLLPDSIMLTPWSLLIHIPLILLSTHLVYKDGNILEYVKPKIVSSSIKNYKTTLYALVILMAIVTSLSSNFFALNSINTNIGFAYSRLYYSIGLLIVGVISDYKSSEYVDVLTIMSLFFPLLATFLLKENVSTNILYCFNYMFLGCFVIFRTITFMNLKDKSNDLIYMSGYGLLLSRIVEGVLALSDIFIKKSYLFYIISIITLLVIIFAIYILKYHKISAKTDNEIIKEIGIKNGLSIQEQKILELLVQGLTNQQIADNLYLSINTIKTHVGNIYKKTGKNKKELQAELLLNK